MALSDNTRPAEIKKVVEQYRETRNEIGRVVKELGAMAEVPPGQWHDLAILYLTINQ
jgi:hypothetical protein